MDGRLELPRLPFTRREAETILAVTPAGSTKSAFDFDASRATATSPELAQYRIIHFATHSILDSKHPELSGLVLSMVDRQGNAANGFLDLEDIYNLNLSADLVVLSACETGLGKEINGEGLVGLTRGFMYAGASRVVASLWKVNDEATQALMSLFYRNLWEKKLGAAEALRQAQLTLYRHPEAVQVAVKRGVDFSESDLPKMEEKPAAKLKQSPTAHWAAFTFSGVRPVPTEK